MTDDPRTGKSYPGHKVTMPTTIAVGVAGSIDDYRMLAAVGDLVCASSQWEFMLRTLVRALTETKYAAVLTAGQSASLLRDECKWLLRVHGDIGTDDRAGLEDSLKRGGDAMECRKRVVHGVES